MNQTQRAPAHPRDAEALGARGRRGLRLAVCVVRFRFVTTQANSKTFRPSLVAAFRLCFACTGPF